MIFFLFLWLRSNCKDSQLPLKLLDRMKAHGSMKLGLEVNCHTRQRLSFFSWQEYRVFLSQLRKIAFFIFCNTS